MSPTCKVSRFPVYIASASRCPISTCAEVLVLGSQINSSPVWGEGLRKAADGGTGFAFLDYAPNQNTMGLDFLDAKMGRPI